MAIYSFSFQQNIHRVILHYNASYWPKSFRIMTGSSFEALNFQSLMCIIYVVLVVEAFFIIFVFFLFVSFILLLKCCKILSSDSFSNYHLLDIVYFSSFKGKSVLLMQASLMFYFKSLQMASKFYSCIN